LRRYSRRTGYGSDFIISATTSEIDDFCVVRILKNPREVALAQAFAVTTEKRASGRSNEACRSRCITTH
jgi:hypothetical protein